MAPGQIKYIVLSDLHFGQDNSLLTNVIPNTTSVNTKAASPVMTSLARVINSLCADSGCEEKPILVLNGDIMELALSDMNRAIMTFDRFIDSLMIDGKIPFSKIIYVPGNHDHHLWESARETQYVNYLQDQSPDPSNFLSDPFHTTTIFGKGDFLNGNFPRGYMMTELVQRFPTLEDFQVQIAYPNLGFYNTENNHCVLIHHGHFIESIYNLATIVMDIVFPKRDKPNPLMPWDIERENFAWIDFFWSAMGRSGDAGKGIEKIYESLEVKSARNRLIEDTAQSLADKYDLPGWDIGTKVIIEKVLKHIANAATKQEKHKKSDYLSDDAKHGLYEYLDSRIRKQLDLELTEANLAPPSHTTFIFGHTHKPFEKVKYIQQWGGLDLYNTGGWVVEQRTPDKIHGASMVLIDGQLNCAALRMYNEFPDSKQWRLGVRTAHDSESNPMSEKLTAWVKSNRKLCEDFSTAAYEAVSDRCATFGKTIDRISKG